MASEILPLDPTEPFGFRCGPEVPCFNACCRDLVQLLTPLDVIRLKQHLTMSSTAFLARYTVTYPGPGTGLPVVSLSPAPGTESACPFVKETGCQVYPARPTSCRTYPVARAICRNRQTGAITERYALIRESHCRGFEARTTQTAPEFLIAQAAAADFAVSDKLMDVIHLKNRLRPGPLPREDMTRCHRALYDLDRFREDLEHQPMVGGSPIPESQWAAAQTNDLALLSISLAWVRNLLFGNTST